MPAPNVLTIDIDHWGTADADPAAALPAAGITVRIYRKRSDGAAPAVADGSAFSTDTETALTRLESLTSTTDADGIATFQLRASAPGTFYRMRIGTDPAVDFLMPDADHALTPDSIIHPVDTAPALAATRFTALSDTPSELTPGQWLRVDEDGNIQQVHAPPGGGGVLLTEITTATFAFHRTSSAFVEIPINLRTLPDWGYVHITGPDGTGDYILFRKADVAAVAVAADGDMQSDALMNSVTFPDALAGGREFHIGRTSAGALLVSSNGLQGHRETISFWGGTTTSTEAEGLSSVEVEAPLTGDGTAGSPIGLTLRDEDIPAGIARDSEIPTVPTELPPTDGSVTAAKLASDLVVPDSAIPAGIARDSEVATAVAAETSARNTAVTAVAAAIPTVPATTSPWPTPPAAEVVFAADQAARLALAPDADRTGDAVLLTQVVVQEDTRTLWRFTGRNNLDAAIWRQLAAPPAVPTELPPTDESVTAAKLAPTLVLPRSAIPAPIAFRGPLTNRGSLTSSTAAPETLSLRGTSNAAINQGGFVVVSGQLQFPTAGLYHLTVGIDIEKTSIDNGAGGRDEMFIAFVLHRGTDPAAPYPQRSSDYLRGASTANRATLDAELLVELEASDEISLTIQSTQAQTYQIRGASSWFGAFKL